MFGNAPPAPLFTAKTSEDVLQAAKKAVALAKKAQDNVVTNHENGAIKPTFSTVILQLALAENELLSTKFNLNQYESSADESLRNASEKAGAIFSNYELDLASNDALFALVDSVYKNQVQDQDQKNGKGLNTEDARLLQCLHWLFVSKGATFAKDSPDRKRFQDIQKRISEIRSELGKNQSKKSDPVEVWLTPEELDGVDPETVASWPRDSESGKVCLQGISTVLENARSETARKQAYLYYRTKTSTPANIPPIKEGVQLRNEAARMLGFDNHAQLMLEGSTGRMGGTTVAEVNRFLDDLIALVKPLGQNEVDALREAKRKDLGASPNTEVSLNPWDSYYYKMASDKEKAGDKKEISAATKAEIEKLFPLDTVVDGMLKLFAQLLGLRFQKEEEDAVSFQAKKTWHEDVSLYQVWNDEAAGGDFVGHLYLDLYLHPGKWPGSKFMSAARPGFQRADGCRSYPAAVLVTDYTKKKEGEDAEYLSVENLVTLLHEFGHSMHELTSRTRYARFHGATGTTIDFGEGPSKMLENWCVQPRVLQLLSGRKDLPLSIFEEAVRLQRGFRDALFHLNQFLIAAFDLGLYQSQNSQEEDEKGSLDIGETYWKLYAKIMPFDPPGPDRIAVDQSYSQFGHIILSDDYGAGYYSYFMADLYASDMFETYFRKDPLDGVAGRAYRHAVLEKEAVLTAGSFLSRILDERSV